MNIYNDLLGLYYDKTSFFGQEANLRADDKVTTSADKRRDFINNFPDYFNRTLSENLKSWNLSLLETESNKG